MNKQMIWCPAGELFFRGLELRQDSHVYRSICRDVLLNNRKVKDTAFSVLDIEFYDCMCMKFTEVPFS